MQWGKKTAQASDFLYKRPIIKIGSALLTANGKGLHHKRLKNWARQIATLVKAGIYPAIVTSGAVAEGMVRLGWKNRPNTVDRLQLAAAVGQIGLASAWKQVLETQGVHCGQVLLSRADMESRSRYLDTRDGLMCMFRHGVVPIINENDAVVTEELKMGDNDMLAGRIVNLVDGDFLLLLTDQEGIYERDPRQYPDSKMINKINSNDERLLQAAAVSTNHQGRGGARTKIAAAQLASHVGINTVVTHGLHPNVILKILSGENKGTFIQAHKDKIVKNARHRWLASLEISGTLVLDSGAVKAVRKQGSSVLVAGVSAIKGNFARGSAICCEDDAGVVICRGLSNYDSKDLQRLLGKNSNEIIDILGYSHGATIMHRNNLLVA